MKRSRFTQGQITGALKEHQAGASVPDLTGTNEPGFWYA